MEICFAQRLGFTRSVCELEQLPEQGRKPFLKCVLSWEFLIPNMKWWIVVLSIHISVQRYIFKTAL